MKDLELLITSDWMNVTLEKMLPYNIEEFPLHIRISSNVEEYTQIGWILPILDIEFGYQHNGPDPLPSLLLNYWKNYYMITAQLTNCGYYFRSPINEIPSKGTIYVVNLTSKSLQLTRDGTTVTSVYFADYGQNCERIWSQNKVWIKFKKNSNLEYRPQHIRGKQTLIIKVCYLIDDRTLN